MPGHGRSENRIIAGANETRISADALAALTADIAERGSGPETDRLHALLADVRGEVGGAKPASGPAAGHEALAVVRRDERELLLSGRLVDSISGLAPGERLGPFPTPGGIGVFFDVFRAAASRWAIVEAGIAAPAIVLTDAQPPVVLQSTTVELDAGTVWIRGDLVTGGLPANAYAGIKVTGGSVVLNGATTVTGQVVETGAPLRGVARLDLAPDEANPADSGCASATVHPLLPASLTFTFGGAGAATVQGSSGSVEAWGQTFEFGQPTGAWTFVERLWAVVLGYDVTPQQFDADPIGDELVHFAGAGDVTGAGLGLPIVLAPNPAVLGAVSHAAEWFLHVDKLTARWYEPDPRRHTLGGAWIELSKAAATIVADGVAPLVPAVSYTYQLWTIAGVTHRLPWRQAFDQPFEVIYRCDVAEGEYFLVRGRAEVALDRPVTTSGVAIGTPTGAGAVLLHRVGAETTAMLATPVDDSHVLHQFALRNALLWTTAPSSVYIRGTLQAGQLIDTGEAQLSFQVAAWGPTLPDPYVSNAFIDGRQIQAGPAAPVLLGRISWTAPDNVIVSFEGRLGAGAVVVGRAQSAGDPRPGPTSQGDPTVGLTQVEQGRLALSGTLEEARQTAQTAEAQARGARVEAAQAANQRSVELIDGFLAEVLGRAPGLLLLDVSTNQDLLGVAMDARRDAAGAGGEFSVAGLAVHSPIAGMRVVALPQVQWEPVRTLDVDQNILTMGWFPTPLASATDGGATHIGARSQRLAPVIPEDVVQGTVDAYWEGTPVAVRTTFPFGLIGAIQLQPADSAQRKADRYDLTRPKFPDLQSVGGIQMTAHAGAAPGGESPTFQGRMRQLVNGVDLPSGTPLGLSVLGETLQPAGSVERVFNNDMIARPRVPVTRIDLSGYGSSNFSDWSNPFAAFAEAAKVQFRVLVGRTSLEVIKVNSVLHPWGVRVTRSVTIERRPSGGVIRRDSGWQAFTPGLFDYRYFDKAVGNIVVAPYKFDAGIFRGLFDVRSIRPAPGVVFASGTAQLVPYYFDADAALEGLTGRTAALGVLGYLQVEPSGVPADPAAIRDLITQQGPIGGPLDAWLDFGHSGLPFRAQRVEVGLTMDGADPLFVATVRGAPRLPKTGAWSVVVRQVAGVSADGGEAVEVAEKRGVPIIRRYAVRYFPGDSTVYPAPPLDGAAGDYRFADAADLLTPAAPASDYALLQSTPTHAFLFPRPSVPAAGAPRLESTAKAALADIFARSTSKGAFPPPANTIQLPAGAEHFDVAAAGALVLNPPLSIVGHPTALRLGGTTGHGSSLFYDQATLRLNLGPERWEADFTGLRIWTDITGLNRLTGAELRIVGSTDQRSQIAEFRTLLLQEIEEILRYIPTFGARGVQGPIDLGASNAKRETKIKAMLRVTIPPSTSVFPAGSGVKLKLSAEQSAGTDLATSSVKTTTELAIELEGKVPLVSVGAAAIFLIVSGKVTFTLELSSGVTKFETLELMAFVGIGVEGKIGIFEAHAFLGVGFILSYDATANKTKYGGLVALEAGVDLKIVEVQIRAELKGLVYQAGGKTLCDYSGSVKIEVDIFVVISISVSYEISDTSTF